MATTDNPFKKKGYVLHARLASAEGLDAGSAVEMAGVRVGAVNSIRIEDGSAIVDLGMDPAFKLPIDSKVLVASRGILGDTVMKVSSGTSDQMLVNDDWIEVTEPPPSLAELQDQLGTVADDVQAITGSLRSLLDSEETRGSVQAILTNIEGFTEDINGITDRNQGDLDAVIDNMRVLSEQLTLLVQESRPEIADEMVSIKRATETLNRGLERIENIAAKIDEGEGTIGTLINDDKLITSMEGVVDDVGALVGQVNRFHIEVYYRGELHFRHGGQPEVDFSGKNVVGLRIKPRPDYWYLFEFVDDPLGDYREEFLFQESAAGLQTIREVRRTDNFQFTFMFAKRFRNLVLRLGLKENGGAVGADLLLLDDRVGLSLDIYDFTWSSFPEETGIPNVKFAVDVEPVRHVYLTVGMENIVNNAVRKEFTWFVGGGVWFTDNDLKWIVGSLPAGAL